MNTTSTTTSPEAAGLTSIAFDFSADFKTQMLIMSDGSLAIGQVDDLDQNSSEPIRRIILDKETVLKLQELLVRPEVQSFL